MIYIIVVIYNMTLSDSAFFRHLGKSFHLDLASGRFLIVVYDNSTESQEVPPDLSATVQYVHDSNNGGVAGAYNYALSLSLADEDWLILVDQDSWIPASFFRAVSDLIKQLGADDSIAAIAPHVLCGKRTVSPCTVHLGGKLSAVSSDFTGNSKMELTAINSGLAVRASFLRQIGGFNKDFWLDYLDHWLCHTIHCTGKKIFVSNLAIGHDLSVSDYNSVSEQRAQNILRAEMLYIVKCKGRHEQYVYLLRLLLRSLKQFISVENKKVAFNTVQAIWQFIAAR